MRILSVIFILFFISACKQQADLKTPAAHYERITITGVAENSKACAIVVTDNGVYYLDEKSHWEDSMHKKKVTVSGIVYTTKTEVSDLKDENGNYSQGSVGEIKHIRNPKISLAE